MKKVFILFFVIMLSSAVQAASINAAAYRSMQMQSYRNNYRRQVNNKPMPYWQVQSNFSTRTNLDYSQYQNSVNQYNYNTRMQRSRYK